MRYLIAPTLLLALLALPLLFGCRHAHLGRDTGRAYHDAFAAQAASAPKRAPTFGAAEAAAALAAKRAAAAKTSAPAAGSVVVPMSTSSSSGSGDAWPGATGNITLEAK